MLSKLLTDMIIISPSIDLYKQIEGIKIKLIDEINTHSEFFERLIKRINLSSLRYIEGVLPDSLAFYTILAAEFTTGRTFRKSLMGREIYDVYFYMNPYSSNWQLKALNLLSHELAHIAFKGTTVVPLEDEILCSVVAFSIGIPRDIREKAYNILQEIEGFDPPSIDVSDIIAIAIVDELDNIEFSPKNLLKIVRSRIEKFRISRKKINEIQQVNPFYFDLFVDERYLNSLKHAVKFLRGLINMERNLAVVYSFLERYERNKIVRILAGRDALKVYEYMRMGFLVFHKRFLKKLDIEM